MQTTKRSLSPWPLLWQLIKYKPRLFAADCLLGSLYSSFPLWPGLLIREFFNSLTGESSWGLSSMTLLVGLLVVGLSYILVTLAAEYTTIQVRFSISSLLRHNIFSELYQYPSAQPLAVSPGEVISYLRDDVTQIEETIVRLEQLMSASLFAVGALIILWQIDERITLLVVGILGIMMVGIRQAEAQIKRRQRTSRLATQQVTGFVNEMFASVQAIQLNEAKTSIIQHFREINAHRSQSTISILVFLAVLNAVFAHLVNLGTGGILLMVALANSSRTASLSIGDLALFVYYLSFISQFLSRLGEVMALLKQSEVTFERMTELVIRHREVGNEEDVVDKNSVNRLSSPLTYPSPLHLNFLGGRQPTLPSVEQPQQNKQPRLQKFSVSDLTYHYPGTNRGIEAVSFSLSRGSFIVVTGSIGSGKTTLLRTLLGLLPHQLGTIFWNGLSVDDPAKFFVPPRIAYTPQVPRLFSHSLRDNILLGLESSPSEVSTAIYQSVFDQDLATMPEGLDTQIGPKGVCLSGGQRQRVAAARMFVRQPELLVFDDLSSSLDVETEQHLWNRLMAGQKIYQTNDDRQVDKSVGRQVNEYNPNSSINFPPYHSTCLTVSHRPEVLCRADYVILLNRGRVEEIGKFDDIKSNRLYLNSPP